MAEIKITDDNYTEILAQDKLVVIDVWATWCGPCQRLAPIFEQVAAEVGDSALLGKYNAENNEFLLERYGVRNIPTILFISHGEVVHRLTGVVNAQQLKELIAQYS